MKQIYTNKIHTFSRTRRTSGNGTILLQTKENCDPTSTKHGLTFTSACGECHGMRFCSTWVKHLDTRFVCLFASVFLLLLLVAHLRDASRKMDRCYAG